ncbi:hypothetical protein COCVIDRAFT_92196 [Bipolaris victoriae FI3]|uniref:Uncharacterized protein n=2 Tax=Bipolaris TaxID=33194 RepID=W6YCN5_COCC2|nr:uncharacterized protein COCCADRAFT_107905 [Bipolaris zeicola 26-R-13]XP_014559394.1 hypothetical protein COCVIDRAFT_92196 [Bipolaris victoriae FI3]EUC28931.1 hypothetical protein COCCADRAFT_107905 [Bipolaris zeicola 26-R-13]
MWCYGVVAHCEHPKWHTSCIFKIHILPIQREANVMAYEMRVTRNHFHINSTLVISFQYWLVLS